MGGGGTYKNLFENFINQHDVGLERSFIDNATKILQQLKQPTDQYNVTCYYYRFDTGNSKSFAGKFCLE